MMWRGIAAVAAVTAALTLPAGGGAGGSSGGEAELSLSTPAAVDAYLTARGLDPGTFVVQVGRLNYAGPDCPGAGWTCTTATRVVQVASAGGTNQSECDPGEVSTSGATTTCVIVQSTTSGQNHASCRLRSTDASPVVLTCQITQSNVDGGNHAIVDETIVQKEGPSQHGTVNANVDQFTVTGQNHVQVKQDIKQSTSAEGAQTQDGAFTADIDQQVEANGQNHCHLTQSLDQDGRTKGSAAQTQTGDQDGDVDQTIGETGEVGVTSQNEASGSSHCTAHQQERKTLVGNGAQTQIGPQACCATQIGGENNTVQIGQDSSARASQPTAFQDLSTIGTFETTGNGKIRHHLRIEEDSTTAQTDTGLLVSGCTSGGEGGGGCFSSEGGDSS